MKGIKEKMSDVESKVFIKLIDKETGEKSQEITIEDLIFNQDEINFKFHDDEIGESTLPYSDFLMFQDDYQVVVRIESE